MTDTAPALSLFDTHAHLDFDRFDADREEVLARARAAGVERIVTIGASRGLSSNPQALALAEAHDFIWAALGVHPHDASLYTEAVGAELEALAAGHPRVVAIGETGLDYFYDHSPREAQQAAFRAFIQMARRVGKPVVIHTRDAEEDTIAILREEQVQEVGGILHCFSGGARLAEAGLELGLHLSFSGMVTFKKATEIQEVARTAPLDRILVETDAPYLAPMPHRGKRNEPAFVEHTLRFVAQLRGMAPAELAAQTSANACRLFGLG